MTELEELHAVIVGRLRLIVETIEAIDPGRLNDMPEGTNSPYVLGAHALGNARAWVLGIACGQDIGRDRLGEFASSGASAAWLRAELAKLESEMAAAFASRELDLDRRYTPRAELWGPSPVREISVRYALLNVLQHASLHLGHLEITRDLLAR